MCSGLLRGVSGLELPAKKKTQLSKMCVRCVHVCVCVFVVCVCVYVVCVHV